MSDTPENKQPEAETAKPSKKAKPAPAPAEKKSPDEFARVKKVAPWKLAAAKARSRWYDGKQVTEAEFDSAIQKVESIRLR